MTDRLRVRHGDGSSAEIACIRENGGGDAGRPGVLWLPGLKSDMASGKATAVADWCRERQITMTRFDYSGHGRSGSDFEQFVVSDWIADAAAVLDQVAKGPHVVIGSSMGGWIGLHLALRDALTPVSERRIAALLLIAPAFDMTTRLMEPQLTADARSALARDGIFIRPSAYDAGGYPITQRLLDDGRNLAFAGRSLKLDLPVRIIHGQRDLDVPWQGSVELAEMITGIDVRLTLLKDGEHRLSRPGDLALLMATLTELTGIEKT